MRRFTSFPENQSRNLSSSALREQRKYMEFSVYQWFDGMGTSLIKMAAMVGAEAVALVAVDVVVINK